MRGLTRNKVMNVWNMNIMPVAQLFQNGTCLSSRLGNSLPALSFRTEWKLNNLLKLLPFKVQNISTSAGEKLTRVVTSCLSTNKQDKRVESATPLNYTRTRHKKILRLSRSLCFSGGDVLTQPSQSLFTTTNSIPSRCFYSTMPSTPSKCFYSTKTKPNQVESALLVKRVLRKKVPKIHEEAKNRQLDNVVAYAIGEEINLDPLKAMLTKQGLYAMGDLPPDATDAIHVRGKYNLDQRPKEIFVFGDGSIVFWCVPEVERGAFLTVLNRFVKAPYTLGVVLSEKEEMDFTYGKEKTRVVNDLIRLQALPEDNVKNIQSVLELYTLSNALAQSVKLSMWEASLDKFVSSVEDVTNDVRLGRKVGMSRQQVLMKSGELMSLRHLINLSSDLLYTPDFYWDRAELEPLYQSLCNQLSISRRTKVMNEKLTHCHELVDLVSHHLGDQHHIRLEIMIIILIFVEVVFEFGKILKEYLEKPTKTPVQEEKEEVAIVSASSLVD